MRARSCPLEARPSHSVSNTGPEGELTVTLLPQRDWKVELQAKFEGLQSTFLGTWHRVSPSLAIAPRAPDLTSSSQPFLLLRMNWCLLIVFFHMGSLKSVLLCFCGFNLTFNVYLANFCDWTRLDFCFV